MPKLTVVLSMRKELTFLYDEFGLSARYKLFGFRNGYLSLLQCYYFRSNEFITFGKSVGLKYLRVSTYYLYK